MTEKMIRVDVPEGSEVAVFVVWTVEGSVHYKKKVYCSRDLEPVPRRSDAQFDDLLKAFSELKEERNRIEEELRGFLDGR